MAGKRHTRFAAEAQQIETEHPGDIGVTHTERHTDLVVAAVVSAATFLEAMVNELFTDAVDGHGTAGDGYLAPLSDDTIRLMATWWREFDEGRDRTLAKYQLLLSFAGQPPLDTGRDPHQSAALVLRLRNAIVHYRPETSWSGAEGNPLERALRGRFAPNALLPAGTEARWPNGSLGAGCARWCVGSVRALADRVTAAVGVRANYQRLGV